jgi:hypothetical protein
VFWRIRKRHSTGIQQIRPKLESWVRTHARLALWRVLVSSLVYGAHCNNKHYTILTQHFLINWDKSRHYVESTMTAHTEPRAMRSAGEKHSHQSGTIMNVIRLNKLPPPERHTT